MFRLFRITGFLIFGLVVSANAAPWRGIIPLSSTRTEVERLLGKPNGKYGRYDLENEEVEILYSAGRCVNGWDVPEGTVIDISVHPKRLLQLSDLKIDFAEYMRARDPHVPSHVYYASRQEGLRYLVYEGSDVKGGKVLTIYYESTLQDVKSLSCSRGNPKKSDSHGTCLRFKRKLASVPYVRRTKDVSRMKPDQNYLAKQEGTPCLESVWALMKLTDSALIISSFSVTRL